MKNSALIIVILLAAVLGGAGMFFLESRLPDNELSNRDINSQLLKLDHLDSSINELALRSRANLDANYDMLVRSTVSMERTINNLAQTYFQADKIDGSLLQTRFDTFRQAMVAKLDQVEDFKSNNSVLRNSELYAPRVGERLAETAANSGLNEVSDLYKKIVIDVLEFTKQGSSKPVADVSHYPDLISTTESKMPSESKTGIIEFSNHVKTAINARTNTDEYLNSVLNSTANDQIEDIFSAWSVFQGANNTVEETLRYYTIAYVITMLGLIGFLVYRLRSLYQNLDEEVEIKAEEVRKAYNELKDSETQLAQSEKMASLGQLVAGVAHEINTPMGYVSANVNSIQQRLDGLQPVLSSVQELSNTASDQNRSKSAITDVVKKQILTYRKLGKGSDVEGLSSLLKDTKEGLLEMQETVKSLISFSHVQDSPTQDVDINERISNALKVCGPTFRQRKVVDNLADELPYVVGVPGQLSQVFVNVFNNAIHATNEDSGIITIDSVQLENDIKIVVRDNGVGIDRDTLKRVLDPFFTTREVGQGTGLGLSISHRIVEAHGGSLKVASELGEGTSVTIVLPQKAEQPGVSEQQERVMRVVK